MRDFLRKVSKILVYSFSPPPGRRGKGWRRKTLLPIIIKNNKEHIYSQLGNVSFPTWEQFIPKVGINFFQRSRSGTHVQAHLNSASPLSLSKNSTERSYTYCIILNVNAVVLFYFAHDEGALDGADVLDIAKFVENKLLILFHIARAYF